MIKKRHIKNTGIIMGITILSCIISAASNTKAMAGSSVPDILNNNNTIYSNGLFNPSFRQAKIKKKIQHLFLHLCQKKQQNQIQQLKKQLLLHL